MMYADYEYYKNEFFGDTISEESFNKFADRASAFIDAITFWRAESAKDCPEVKKACCAVAEEVFSTEQNGGVLQSETSGSYSRSFKVDESVTVESELYNAAYLYLANTGLLFRGW